MCVGGAGLTVAVTRPAHVALPDPRDPHRGHNPSYAAPAPRNAIARSPSVPRSRAAPYLGIPLSKVLVSPLRGEGRPVSAFSRWGSVCHHVELGSAASSHLSSPPPAVRPLFAQAVAASLQGRVAIGPRAGQPGSRASVSMRMSRCPRRRRDQLGAPGALPRAPAAGARPADGEHGRAPADVVSTPSRSRSTRPWHGTSGMRPGVTISLCHMFRE